MTTRRGCSRRLVRPAFVPRTTGRRQETSRTAGAANPQVKKQIRVSSQLARSAPRTLSRWRHGFEPRWDYQEPRIDALGTGADGRPPRERYDRYVLGETFKSFVQT